MNQQPVFKSGERGVPAAITKPEGKVRVVPQTSRKGREYYEVVDDAGAVWGFAYDLDDAHRIRASLMGEVRPADAATPGVVDEAAWRQDIVDSQGH